MVAENTLVGWAVNFRVHMLLEGTVRNQGQANLHVYEDKNNIKKQSWIQTLQDWSSQTMEFHKKKHNSDML